MTRCFSHALCPLQYFRHFSERSGEINIQEKAFPLIRALKEEDTGDAGTLPSSAPDFLCDLGSSP